MTCVSPPELDDIQLMAYLDGEVDHSVVSHLAHCPYCRDKADRLAHLQHRLATRLYRIECPSPMELGEYHLGLLDSTRTATVARHLDECPHCTHEIAELKTYLNHLAPTLELSLPDRIKVLIARLVSGAQGAASERVTLTPAFAGIRGEQAGPAVYQTDGVQVAIEIQSDVEQPDRQVMLGLVTGLETRPLTAHLWQAERLVTTAPVDEAGNFVIPHLTPGRYELILSGPDVEIHIQALEV
ncbi:MAG TPA: hypothetical protein VIK33_06520 [Anaerolineae bacterium]